MKKYLLLINLIFPIILYPQGIENDGAIIKITTGAYIYIGSGGYTNASNSTNTTHGTIENDGTISLTGNWMNNAASAINKVFTNSNAIIGTVAFIGNTTPQLIGGENPTNFENLTINKTNNTDIVRLDNTMPESNGYNSIGDGTNGTLTLTSGIFSLNSHRIVINNPSTTAISYSLSNSGVLSETYDNGSSYGSNTFVNTCTSKIQWNIGTSTGTYTFPFITALRTTVRFVYAISATGAGVGAAGNVSVSTYHTNNLNYPYPSDGANSVVNMMGYYVPENSANAIDRFWIANVSDYTTKPTAYLTLYYDAVNDLNSLLEENLQAQRWIATDPTHGYWYNTPAGIPTPASHRIRNILTNNSINCNIWVGTNNLIPLPIQLLSFDGKCTGKETMLYWTTATETNNDFFTIEKSNDMENWTIVTTAKGAGNSNSILNYTAYDYFPTIGITEYYRLKQTDYDGKYAYSDVISVKCSENSNVFSIINIYQQGNQLMINCNNPEELPFNIDLFDVMGRKMIPTKYYSSNNALYQVKIDISGLLIGCYMAVIYNQNTKISQKIVINKY